MRPAPRTRTLLAACAVPALLLGLGACGTTAPRPVAAHPAAQASSLARWDEKTLVPAMKAALEKQRSVHMSIRGTGTPGGPLRAEGDAVRRGSGFDLAMTTGRTPMGGPAAVRVVDGVVYLSVPPMTPQGKFLEIRPGDASSPLGGMTGGMRALDPAHAFSALQDGVRKVAYVGEELVQGRRLAHYRLTVDPRAVVRSHDAPRVGAMPGPGGMMRRYGAPRAATFDVWVDGDALVHRLELRKAHEGSLTVDLSDWGAPVTVQAPAPGDIVKGSGQWPVPGKLHS